MSDDMECETDGLGVKRKKKEVLEPARLKVVHSLEPHVSSHNADNTSGLGKPIRISLSSGITDSPLSRVNPLKIGKWLYETVGDVVEVKPSRSGDLFIQCQSYDQAQTLLQLKFLDDSQIPIISKPLLKRDFGVIYGISNDISETDLLDCLSQYEVIQVKRLMKSSHAADGKRISIPSSCVLLTFKVDPESVSDNTVPEHVTVGYQCFPVKPYVPTPMRCFNCQRFGHTARTCRGKVRCATCGEMHEREAGTQCDREKKCANCGGPHSAAYRGCPKFKDQKAALQLKIQNRISYADAVKKVKRI